VLADAKKLPKVLQRLSGKAVQGTVARSGEVLVLAFDALAPDRSR
jgi:flagella basal body P-ring formation protein FlgA